MVSDKKNFSWLLVALLAFLFGIPASDYVAVLTPGMERALVISWLLVVGVWSLRGFAVLFRVGLALAGLGVVLSAIAAVTADELFRYASFGALFAFLLVAMLCVGRHVIFGDNVSVNRLVGAVSLYLLVGVAWAIAYTVTEMAAPGSFRGLTAAVNQGWNSDWLYFSFVTMSTLGYGDFAPVSPIARMLAYLQAVFGLFYIAILVAGLVGAFISSRLRNPAD
jgi:hypothetical protein